MTSILTADLCFECNKDNGINSGTHCKFCYKPMYKNKWNVDMKLNIPLVLSTKVSNDNFKDFIIKDEYSNKNNIYTYRFIFNNLDIDFENEKIVFRVKDLSKPLIIKFESINKYDLNYSESGVLSVLSIILYNGSVIGIGYNSYNEQIYKILNKLVNK